MNHKSRRGSFLVAFTMFVMVLAMIVSAKDAEAKGKKPVNLNRTQITAYKGMKPMTLKVKNAKASQVITWKSKNTNVAAVSPEGVVSFVGKGNAIILAKVGKKTLKCIVSVSSKKAYEAVSVAMKYYKARNMSYSQGNRMGSRSADCSSFCGRCYLAQGMTLGGSSSWCNTAAGMAQWSSSNKKVVANGSVSVSSLKMLPGDLVFYQRGYNGRYKNIYHVEIFVGYELRGEKLVGYTMSSITGNYPSILKRDYGSRQSRVCQVARPAE